MRALRERLQSVTVPAASHPLDDSGEEEDGIAKVLANSEPPPFKLRPEVSPSRSHPAACPASVAASTPGTSRKRTGKPRSRMPKTTRERTRHEAEIPRLGGKPPDPQAESLEDRTRAWREMTHQEHMAAAALVQEDEKWRDAWLPEGWRRYRRRWYRWHGKVNPNLAVTENAVQLSLETECGTIPGSGGDVGIPDAWCSLYRVHQWNQREREAAEDAALSTPRKMVEALSSPGSCESQDEEDSGALPPSFLELNLSPSSSHQTTAGTTQDTEDSQTSLNFTQQLMERQLAITSAERSLLATVLEKGEPTVLEPMREEDPRELFFAIQKHQPIASNSGRRRGYTRTQEGDTRASAGRSRQGELFRSGDL